MPTEDWLTSPDASDTNSVTMQPSVVAVLNCHTLPFVLFLSVLSPFRVKYVHTFHCVRPLVYFELYLLARADECPVRSECGYNQRGVTVILTEDWFTSPDASDTRRVTEQLP